MYLWTTACDGRREYTDLTVVDQAGSDVDSNRSAGMQIGTGRLRDDSLYKRTCHADTLCTKAMCFLVSQAFCLTQDLAMTKQHLLI